MGFGVWDPYHSESSHLEVRAGLFVGNTQYWVFSDHEYNTQYWVFSDHEYNTQHAHTYAGCWFTSIHNTAICHTHTQHCN